MFTPNTINFLVENKMNNSKIWFTDHKDEFNEFVIQPLAQLVSSLTPTIHQIDSKIDCTPKVGKCISRIYRDTRFSKDKSLYRDVMWIVFMQEKKLYNGNCGFFFELSPNGFRYGCGYYQAPIQVMDNMRKLIDKKDISFDKAQQCYEQLNKEFHIYGELYKKTKYKGKDEIIRHWYDRRDIGFIRESTDVEFLFSNKLLKQLSTDFMKLKDIYDFLYKAEKSK